MVQEAVSIRVGGSSVKATVTGTHIEVVGADPTVRSRIEAVRGGRSKADLVSQEFVASADGEFRWDGIIFPAAGTWRVSLVKSGGEDDGDEIVGMSQTVLTAAGEQPPQ